MAVVGFGFFWAVGLRVLVLAAAINSVHIALSQTAALLCQTEVRVVLCPKGSDGLLLGIPHTYYR